MSKDELRKLLQPVIDGYMTNAGTNLHGAIRDMMTEIFFRMVDNPKVHRQPQQPLKHMIIDIPIPAKDIRQFASQLPKVSPTDAEIMAKTFTGNQSADFYKGLAAGLAAIHAVILSGTMTRDTAGIMLAYVSDLMERKEII